MGIAVGEKDAVELPSRAKRRWRCKTCPALGSCDGAWQRGPRVPCAAQFAHGKMHVFAGGGLCRAALPLAIQLLRVLFWSLGVSLEVGGDIDEAGGRELVAALWDWAPLAGDAPLAGL